MNVFLTATVGESGPRNGFFVVLSAVSSLKFLTDLADKHKIAILTNLLLLTTNFLTIFTADFGRFWPLYCRFRLPY